MYTWTEDKQGVSVVKDKEERKKKHYEAHVPLVMDDFHGYVSDLPMMIWLAEAHLICLKKKKKPLILCIAILGRCEDHYLAVYVE